MTDRSKFTPVSAFSFYLRTGRRVIVSEPAKIEVKYNPWHDPEDGRFTFAGRGNYFGRGSRSAPDRGRTSNSSREPGRAPPGDGLTEVERGRRESAAEFRDPRNFTRYVVRKGDNLTKIAQVRRGLTISFLAQVNGITDPDLLPVGAVLRVPSQRWLDTLAERQERLSRFLFYFRRHGLPPIPRTPEEAAKDVNLARLPSIEEQIAADLRTYSSNGYMFTADPIDRVPYSASGKLQFGTRAQRSKKEQLNAGGSDRRPSDQGGHLIASMFNGPGDWFNHFAQDANFNNGAFKKQEISWKKLGEAGHVVVVEITAYRKDGSKRPYAINVEWTVDGKKFEKDYLNEAGGQQDER